MSGNSQVLVARLLWAVPLMLAWLTIHQFGVAADLSETMNSGTLAMAEVTRYERSDRKDVTHAEMDLRATLADGSVFERQHLALPYSIAHRVEQDSVEVRILPGADQPVVLTAIVGTQRSIALSNGAMSLIAFLLTGAGVWAWNRYLRRGAAATKDAGTADAGTADAGTADAGTAD